MTDIYNSIGDLDIKNTLIAFNHQFRDPHSFRICNEYRDVLKNNDIRVLDLKELGLLDWVYITPIFFDPVGQLIVGGKRIRHFLSSLPKKPNKQRPSNTNTSVSAQAEEKEPDTETPSSKRAPARPKRVGDKFEPVDVKRASEGKNDDVMKKAQEMMAQAKYSKQSR